MPRYMFVLFVVITCFLSLSLFATPDQVKSDFGALGFQLPVETMTAPGLTAMDMAGKAVNLNDYRGQVLVVNLWATWCPPCREEMPSMERLYAAFKDRGLTILAVSSTMYNDTQEKVKAFAAENRLTFPVLFDSEGLIDASYQTGSLPTSYIIGRDGTIIARIIGAIDWSTPAMFRVIEKLVEL